MELALYHQVYGYYSDPLSRVVGRKGDFFTSVSVGDTFGSILSHKIEEEWRESFGSAENFVIVEQGAHDAQLARDILAALEKRNSPLFSKVEYRIVEPRDAVREKLIDSTGSGDRIKPVASFEEASAECGVFLCNELLDAFPVRRVVYRAGEWRELCVGVGENSQLAYLEGDVVVEGLLPEGEEFPDNYMTELCPAARNWIQDAAGLFEKGKWWVIDYGHESDDYFAVSRNEGTLRCYRAHTATDDPFSEIGEIDITAHVNFTHLREWAEDEGMMAEKLTDQHHFLTHAAKPWLLAMEGHPPDAETAGKIRQFQTLTHPSLMGQQFKVLELAKGFG